MGTCRICNATSAYIGRELGVCLPCIRRTPDDALPVARQAHARSRAAFGLPPRPPDDPEGVPCALCVNECRIPEHGFGLPSNCVADWVCPGGTGEGYPQFARCPGPEEGCTNLAVFFHACTFDCLYCQNWQYRLKTSDPATSTPEGLAAHVDRWTTCICYFGGDPSSPDACNPRPEMPRDRPRRGTFPREDRKCPSSRVRFRRGGVLCLPP